MKKFILHGEMASDFCKEISLKVNTMREAINGLSSNFPKFRKYYIKKTLSGVQYLFVDEKQNAIEQYCFDLPLTEDVYHILPSVQGSNGALPFVANFGLGYLMQKFMSDLQPEDDGTPEYEVITTNSFIYTQNENRAEQGTPIPVVYGQLRVGSKVIQSSIHNYDYNYDDAEIYAGNPQPTKIAKMASDYSFIEPKEIQDLRTPTTEAFIDYKDSRNDASKRNDIEIGSDGEKMHSISRENEPMNAGYDNNRGKSSNEHRSFGPSSKTPTLAKANASWWNLGKYNSQPRPFIYPPSGSIDDNMRPQHDDDLCGERLSKAGLIPSEPEKVLSWRDAGDSMNVGVRGNYQKLESIGIHKSLEVLSEGPIAGLASHITGSEFDNGNVYFPYESADISPSPSSIKLESIKYDFNTNSLMSQSNNSTVTIMSSGSNYNNFTGILSGDGTIFNGLSIKADSPKDLSSAKISDIRFNGPDDPNLIVYHINNSSTPDEPKYVSSNGLFLLNSGDGAVHPNTNNDADSIDNTLDAKYLIEEATDNAATTGVFQLQVLEEDSNDLEQDFRIGSNYGRDGFQFSISPDSARCIISSEISKTQSFDRESTSSVLDAGTRFLDLTFSPDFEAVFDEFKTYNDTDLPWDNSLAISQMVRIYYDQNGGSNLVDGDGDIRNININVIIGTYTQDRFRQSDITRNLSVDISLDTYLQLGDVTVNFNNDSGRTKTSVSPNRTSLDPANPLIDYFDELCDTDGRGNAPAAQSLSLLLRDPNFANDVFNAFNGQMGGNLTSVTLPSFDLPVDDRTVTHGGGLYIKFGVGSGSDVAQGNFSDNIPLHTLQRNCDHFNDLLITDSGIIDEDSSGHPKGKYHPLLYPRITVYILRKTMTAGLTSFAFHPTNIDAVAEINSQGLIENVHLLRVPDNPVFDTTNEVYTPILPQSDRQAPFLASDIAISYEDLGVFCKIDNSDSEMDAKLYIENGSLVVSPARRDTFEAELLWSDHIQQNAPSTDDSFAAGLFAETLAVTDWNNSVVAQQKVFQFDNLDEEFAEPDTVAEVTINIESIDISDAAIYKVNSINNSLDTVNNFDFICTGRPTSLTVSNAGSGYTSADGENVNGQSITKKIFPETHTISKINISSDLTSNLGYKPNSEFYVWGISNTKQAILSNILAISYISFKAKVTTDKYGSIEDFNILDGGFGFNDNTSITDDLILMADFSADPLTSDVYDFARLRELLPPDGDDPNLNILPDTSFPKQDLIFTVDNNHLRAVGSEGSVTKFYVEQIGLGFNYAQILLDPFTQQAFTPPSFDVEIDNGILQSIQINNVFLSFGYGVNDSNIRLKFSSPTNFEGPPAEGSPDEHARFRSIFLNDVPIRDKNDRFNYSKFHFDMRVGHFKNGNSDTHFPLDKLATSAQPILMSDEFKLPSHTKIVNYPLFGPRNQGEKDYYYTHTIKNPEISVVSLSFKIEKLHYVYEGDESAMYVNLIPLIAMGIGIIAGKMMADTIKDVLSIPDPIMLNSKGRGKVIGYVPCFGGSGFMTLDDSVGLGKVMKPPPSEVKRAAQTAAFYGALFGAVGGLIASQIAKFLIKCSNVPWLCFKVGEIIKNSGEIWPAKVEFAIEYGVEGQPLSKDVIAVRGCATNSYVKDVLIENLPAAEGSFNNFKNRIIKVYRLTRELDPVNGGIVEARYQIESSLLSVTEHVAGFFNYNNTAIIGTRVNSKDHPEIPRKEYLIKGRLIKVPDNYNPTNGTYSGEWAGSFDDELKWTSNPAWIIYDLLTNERYGMGKYGIKDSDIDIWSFYTFSKFCDERVDSIIDGSVLSERRHMCNLYLDSERQAYDYIKELLRIYNCTINFSGGTIYISSDSSVASSTDSIMIFTNSNVSEEGFSYSSTPETHRITAATIDYLDERDNYIQKSEYVEDSIGIREHGYSHVKVAGIGITRRGEAHRLAWHKILTRQLEQEIIQFKTGLSGSYLRIGDVVDVLDNNKVSSHSGGRIVNVISANVLELDIPASALSNVTKISVEVPIVSDDYSDTSDSSEINDRRSAQFKTYTISARNNFQVTLTENIDSAIKKGSSWIVAENNTDNIRPKKYRIKQVKEFSPMQFEFTATEYLEDKYENIDNSTSSKDGIYLEEREYYGHEIVV